MIVHFETLGCKLNQIESESACKAFNDEGFQVTSENSSASQKIPTDIVENTKLCIINTCTVTAKAEQKCRRLIHLLLNIYPNSLVIVTGCYAEVESDFLQKIDNRILVIPGTKKDILSELPQKIKELTNIFPNLLNDLPEFSNQLKLLILKQNTNFTEKSRFKLSTDTFFQHSRSSIKIQDGCANSCTFCRIHIARGKPVSLESSEVLARIQKLEQVNQKEVVLTGVNLSQYNSVIDGKKADFADLLDYLNKNTKEISFRISSLYPERLDEKLCTIIKNSRVRPHFHLSIQSGSDKILLAMARPYKAQQVYQAVQRIRDIYENPFIACDIIAGFPGETDEDFELTMKLCTECNFTWIHAFPFSPRPGTKAYTMKPIIPQNIVRKRIQRLTELADNNKRNYILSYINKDINAIVEKRQDKIVRCVTENFLHVHLILENSINPLDIAGKQVIIRITGLADMEECDCTGILVNSIANGEQQ